MGRLTIFAKGNLDLRDSLHLLRSEGRVLWNGVNDILRERFPGESARVRHETFTRSDALLQTTGSPPAELTARNLPLGAHPCASQFSDAVFDGKSDVVILSIQADVMVRPGRRRQAGYLFHPNDFQYWSEQDRAWFREAFEPYPFLDAEQSMQNFRSIIDRIRAGSDASILIYNLSAVVPGDSTHVHSAASETLATRIRRFNMALVDLSSETGVSIIDVDALIAKGGADRLKIDTTHLTAEGCRVVAAEVVRVLEDLGRLPVQEAARSSRI